MSIEPEYVLCEPTAEGLATIARALAEAEPQKDPVRYEFSITFRLYAIDKQDATNKQDDLIIALRHHPDLIVFTGTDPVEVDDEEEDEDPRCVCGAYKSEHALCGCTEGFQSLASWNTERDAIREHINKGGDYDDEGRPIFDNYHDDDIDPDDNDDFPLSLEYDGLHGGDDFHNEQAAQDEDA